MPPSGGIVVSAGGFSTAVVEAAWKSLWTSLDHGFCIRHLPRIAQELHSDFPRGAAIDTPVFHSRCAPLLYKPVDKSEASFVDNHLARNVDVLPGSRCFIARFSTAIVDRRR